MKRARRRVIVAALSVVFAATIAALYYGSVQAGIGAAYAAKVVCSGVFVSGREVEPLLAIDVAADGLSFLRHTDVKVDREKREVVATLFGLATRRAVYREGRAVPWFTGKRQDRPRIEPTARRITHASDEWRATSSTTSLSCLPNVTEAA